MSDNSSLPTVNKEMHLTEIGKYGKIKENTEEVNGDIIKNETTNNKKKEEKNGKIVKNQGRNVRSTRVVRQNDEGTSSNKSNGNDNNETEEEEEKGPKKRKHFPVFEKASNNKKDKKFKKGLPLKIWSWNVAGLRANVKVCL